MVLADMAFTKQNNKAKINYKYRKFQKVNLDSIQIDGEFGNPGDMTIMPRNKNRFKNRLPYRTNFNKEIRIGIERIR